MNDTPGTATASGATQKIARHTALLQYESLPARLVALTKLAVLDTLGVTIGAATLAPEASIVVDYVSDLGGKAESTVLGFGTKAPAPWAVFANGSLGHMLDYDDMGAGHMSIETVPVALALAEKLGHVNGRDFITAIAAGSDIMMRLNLAVNIPDWTMTEGWFATQLFGFVAGTATAARVMRLQPEQTENALGIGFNQMSGSRQMAVGAATHMRAMQAGFSGQGAVLAAELAQRGIIGSREFLEGRYGPAVLAMADRIFYRDLPPAQKKSLLPSVEVLTTDGRTITHELDGVPGDARHPVKREFIEAKFRDCVAFSAKPIPAGNVERVIELVATLEDVDDVSEIVRLLT